MTNKKVVRTAWDEYVDWLIDRISFNAKSYKKLIDILSTREFYWSVDHDDNRAEDGKMLREDFFDAIGVSGARWGDNCTILEMLIGLAIRMDLEYVGDPSNPHPDDIFESMLDNLGLLDYKDRNFSADEVNDILDAWLDREFDYNGDGSIFPLEYPITDQRTCEIWSQMQAYIGENYY
jgi:hypothetical protein